MLKLAVYSDALTDKINVLFTCKLYITGLLTIILALHILAEKPAFDDRVSVLCDFTAKHSKTAFHNGM